MITSLFSALPSFKGVSATHAASHLGSHCCPPGVHPPVLPPFRPACPAPAGSVALAGLSPGLCLLLCDLCVALPDSLMATLLSPSLFLGAAPSFLQSLG